MEKMEEVLGRREPQEHVHVGQAKVSIYEDDFFVLPRKTQGQIDGEVGFAHSALAGCYGKYEREIAAHAYTPGWGVDVALPAGSPGSCRLKISRQISGSVAGARLSLSSEP